jgi:hypothetical protein
MLGIFYSDSFYSFKIYSDNLIILWLPPKKDCLKFFCFYVIDNQLVVFNKNFFIILQNPN